MSVFAISDLHLSLNSSTNKSMEVFGRRWQGYVNKLENNWRALVSEEDTVILAGDISWALSTEEAKEDFRFLHELPGKKIIGKGNHDFWWQTMNKLNKFKEKNALASISFLYNNAFVAEDFIVCGTRGWFYDPACDNIPAETDFAKIIARETVRLRMSLDAAVKLKAEHPEKEILVFLHFPAVWAGKSSEEILAVLKEYGVRRCFYGHIHGSYDMLGNFEAEGIRFTITSADFLHFTPLFIAKD
jgi:predicted phosphohydrolase